MSLRKKLLLVFGFLFLIILGVGVYIHLNIQSIANDILREEIIKNYNSSPETSYLISLEKVKLNYVSGSVKLINVGVTPKDSLVAFKTSISGVVYKSTKLQIHIDEIELSNFDYIKAFSERIIVAEKFNIKNPEINIFQHEGESHPSNKKQDTVDLRSVFLANFNSFHLGKLSITDAKTTFKKVTLDNDTNLVFSVNHVSYHITDVFINAKTLYTPEYLEFNKYLLSSKNLTIELKTGAVLKMGQLAYDSETDKLKVSSFSFEPKIKPAQFFKTIKYRKAWISLVFKEAIISNLDILHLLHNSEILASSLVLTDPQLKIFTNATIPFDPNFEKPMLGTMLKSVKKPYFIDSVFINNANIDIDMIGKNTPNHGQLFFHELNVTGSNLTNEEARIAENKTLTLHANSKVNKTGNISANFKINLADDNGTTQFNLNGTNLQLTAFNTVLKPILRVSILDGVIKSLRLSSTLSKNGAIGKMDLHYENLKLQLEGKEVNKAPGFFNKMASSMANGILKTNNIPGQVNYHQGNIKFQKKKEDSFFKMLWIINLRGIEDSILGSNARDTRKANKKKRTQSKQKNKSNKKKWFK